jgi:hypothetical protein
MNENQPILFTLQLNVDQINVILSQVGKLPYETISGLMDTIRGQVSTQIQQIQEQQAAAQAADSPLAETPDIVQ